MEALCLHFHQSATGSNPQTLKNPGPAGLVDFFTAASLFVEEKDVQAVYVAKEWAETKSMMWEDIEDVV
eukprot:5973942-Karenia_brevis.AAC.1